MTQFSVKTKVEQNYLADSVVVGHLISYQISELTNNPVGNDANPVTASLKGKRGFGQGFPNWLKLSNMVR